MKNSLPDNPLFTIIMPNYNNVKYIEEAIKSVIMQKYTNWELVIIDDASTDNSIDVIKTFLGNDKINLLTNDVNRGVAYSAKKGVDHSSGHIIGTLDSDDILMDEALLVMVNAYRDNPGYGLIYSNHYICDKNSEIIKTAEWLAPCPDDICLQEYLLGKEDNVTISMHFRTYLKSSYDKTEGYDVSLLCYEDRDLYYKLEKVTKIKGINSCLYYYRHSDEMGAYRHNRKEKYYWFICEYKETKRRLGIKLPFADKNSISPFLSNLMYIYLRRHSNIIRDKLRLKLQYFLFETGYDKLKHNKLLAFLYLTNSYLYGFTPITFIRIKKYLLRM